MNDNRPLYSLTVAEFKELSKIIQLDLKYLAPSVEKPIANLPDVIFLDEAITITGYTKSTLYSKISKSEVPVISNGRPLTFSRAELINWMKAGRPTVAEMMAESFHTKNFK